MITFECVTFHENLPKGECKQKWKKSHSKYMWLRINSQKTRGNRIKFENPIKWWVFLFIQPISSLNQHFFLFFFSITNKLIRKWNELMCIERKQIKHLTKKIKNKNRFHCGFHLFYNSFKMFIFVQFDDAILFEIKRKNKSNIHQAKNKVRIDRLTWFLLKAYFDFIGSSANSDKDFHVCFCVCV